MKKKYYLVHTYTIVMIFVNRFFEHVIQTSLLLLTEMKIKHVEKRCVFVLQLQRWPMTVKFYCSAKILCSLSIVEFLIFILD